MVNSGWINVTLKQLSDKDHGIQLRRKKGGFPSRKLFDARLYNEMLKTIVKWRPCHTKGKWKQNMRLEKCWIKRKRHNQKDSLSIWPKNELVGVKYRRHLKILCVFRHFVLQVTSRRLAPSLQPSMTPGPPPKHLRRTMSWFSRQSVQGHCSSGG